MTDEKYDAFNWQPLGQRVAVETSTRLCKILYITVKQAIALCSSRDCQTLVIFQKVYPSIGTDHVCYA